LLVGLVGLTGVGGGSLMTILLWFAFRQQLVGTDLLYAAFTKMGGVFVHHRKIILIGLSRAGFPWVVLLR
jgi:uncharacterized membrane protein YfcA